MLMHLLEKRVVLITQIKLYKNLKNLIKKHKVLMSEKILNQLMFLQNKIKSNLKLFLDRKQHPLKYSKNKNLFSSCLVSKQM